MTEHDSDIQPTDDPAPAAAVHAEGTDQGSDRPPSFLAELASAMQSTAVAERTRDTETTEQRRQAYIDGIRAREALEADQLRDLAKEDVTAIDAWSDGEIRRIKLERERRIAERREQLQSKLEEHRQVIGREVDAVEAAVVGYRNETDAFFDRLQSETDPVEIARQAGTRPGFPMLELIGPEDAPVDPVVVPGDATAPVAADGSDAASADAPASEPTPEASGTTQGADATTTDRPDTERLIGVMDGEAAAGVPTSSWSARVIAEPTPLSRPAPVAAPVGAPARSDETAKPEPVAASEETPATAPRSGAGSWLRWPNSSPDRSDSDR